MYVARAPGIHARGRSSSRAFTIRRLWRLGFIGHAIFNAAFWLLPFTPPRACGWLVYALVHSAKAGFAIPRFEAVLPRCALSRHGWFYILSSPLVALLYLYNMIALGVGVPKLYGDRYITNWSPPTKLASLAAPPQTKAEHDHFFCHVALQRDVRDVFLLG